MDAPTGCSTYGARRVGFIGIRLTLPRGWELSGNRDHYSSGLLSQSVIMAAACRSGTLVVTAGREMYAGEGSGTPYDSADDWGFGQSTQDVDCLPHSDEFELPKDAWKYERGRDARTTCQGLPAFLGCQGDPDT